MLSRNLIIIAGPTAIGKTSLSIEIAKIYNCPILSADSRQFYKEMDIGTSKPTNIEMEGVPHYFINSRSVTDEYNVGKYENDAINLIETLFQTNSCIILVGGSGLFINAVCCGFDELPQANEEIRNEINLLFTRQGIEGLQQALKKHDINYYLKVDLNNIRRISRALEVCLITGKTYTELRKGEIKNRNFNIIKIGLNALRPLLYSRINQRVDQMMLDGLLNEVKSLQKFKHLNALQTVGYKELFNYLEGNADFKSTIELIKRNTRRYAKRQLTWFLKDKEIEWFEPYQLPEILTYINKQKTG